MAVLWSPHPHPGQVLKPLLVGAQGLLGVWGSALRELPQGLASLPYPKSSECWGEYTGLGSLPQLGTSWKSHATPGLPVG